MSPLEIEESFRSSSSRPFPYEDARRIAAMCHKSAEDLIPELDWFFSSVAGYSSSATRLTSRSQDEVSRARDLMSKSFFERFPELEDYRPLINEVNVPNLYDQMTKAEALRVALLELLSAT